MCEFNIAIDIGNTNSRFGLVNLSTLKVIKRLNTQTSNLKKHTDNYINELLKNANKKKLPIFISNVSEESNNLIFKNFDSATFIKYSQNLPFTLEYDNPQTFGADRIANLLYASTFANNHSSIVIDVGTAITIDAINNNGIFIGGAILPGISTQLNSLNKNTSQLPDIFFNTSTKNLELGKSTKKSIVYGVICGIGGAISSIVSQIKAKLNTSPQIFTCGGDWNTVSRYVNFSSIYDPDLTLIGTSLFKQ